MSRFAVIFCTAMYLILSIFSFLISQLNWKVTQFAAYASCVTYPVKSSGLATIPILVRILLYALFFK